MGAEKQKNIKTEPKKRNNEHRSGHWTWTLFKVFKPINIRNIHFIIDNFFQMFNSYNTIHVMFTGLLTRFFCQPSRSLALSLYLFRFFLFHFLFQFTFYMFQHKRRTRPVTAIRDPPLRLPNEWMNMTLRFKLLIGTIINLDAVKEKWNVTKNERDK